MGCFTKYCDQKQYLCKYLDENNEDIKAVIIVMN